MVLAPQLRQSLKILQVPALELRNVILEELQTNPALEELPMDGISFEEQVNGTASKEEESFEGEEMEFGKDFEIFRKIHEDYRAQMAEESGSFQFTSEDEERRKHFFDSITCETSLQEDLIRQAELTDAPAEIIRAIEFLVGSLDDSGFLSSSLSDVALMAGLPLETVQKGQRLLKTLDPPGIGANDLRDCLMVQLELQGRRSTIAYQIIRDHFELLLRRRIPEIARRIGVANEDVQAAIQDIADLDPAPGRKFSDDSNRVVVPDVRVEKDDTGEWLIHLNSDYIPRLRISNTYKEMIARGRLTRKEKEYIQDKFRSGKFLISSIEQRQQTIERITREILRFQADFFEEGKSKLRPLTMNQVAEAVGVHETTVSRAIANKYIDTPHGVFDFKFFFTPGYQGSDGTAVSNTSVKGRIAKIIEDENKAKPFSDQQIVEILKGEGVQIARRTVAKYREELGILPTNLRRQYN